MTDFDEFQAPEQVKPTMPKGGRPKGAKNKSTLLREALNNQFEEALQVKFEAVVSAVMQEAIDGNMVAAKMILDRIIPVHKAADFKKISSGGMEITINVAGMEGRPDSVTIDMSDVEEAQFEEEEDG